MATNLTKLQNRTPVGRIIVQLLDSREQIYSLPFVAQVVLQGFKSEETAEQWRELFEGLTYLESDYEAAARAAAPYRSLRGKVITIQTADAQIAAACLHHDLKLLTLDQEFGHIQGFQILKV